MSTTSSLIHKLQKVAVRDIRPGPNVRKPADPDDLAALAESLKAGQQQPIIIDADNTLIDGSRRWMAAQRAEMEWLWAIVTNRPLTDAERTVAQMVMSLHRQDFTDVEKVAACEALLAADASLDQKRLADKFQVNPATVSRWMCVTADRVIPEVRAAFDEGRIKLMAAYALSQAPKDAQAGMLSLALQGATRAQLQTRVRKAARPTTAAASKRVRCVLPDGVSVTICGPQLALDDIVEHLLTLLKSARKARDQHLDARSWEQVLSRTAGVVKHNAGNEGGGMMYRLSRVLLQCSMYAVGYMFALLTYCGWPTTAIPLVLGGLALALRRRTRRLTTLGSARWADSEDLQQAGMLEARSGLMLGRVPVEPSECPPLVKLFDSRIKDQQACQAFFNHSKWIRWELVRLHLAVHTAVFAPTGVGKGVSCIIPFLLSCDEPCIVVDFKGENARITAEHRRKMFGHRIVMLDPYGVVTKTPDCFNPLDRISEDDPQALDECHDLAEALVVRTGDEPERHWNDSAEAWVSAMIATTVCHGRPHGARSLQGVRNMLSSPESIALAIKLMRQTTEWDGMLARMGGQLTHYVEREKSSVLTTVSRHLRFLDSPAIAASTKHSSFDPAELRNGKMTVYLILPPEHMRAQSALLRMWIGGLLRAVVRGGLRTKGNVHFILDEAASLGHLEAIDDALDKFRGYGVRLQFYFQSVGQLRRVFPNGQDQTLLSNTTQVYFGVNDGATAELVSTRLGEQTIVVDSGGTSDGHSSQNTMGEHPSQSTGQSFTRNSNWNQMARRLLKPEEVIALPPRAAITFTPGVPPICSHLIRYYEEPKLFRRTSRLFGAARAAGTLLLALMFFSASIAGALFFTMCAAKAGY